MAEDKTNKGQELFPDISKDRLRLSSKISSALKSNGLDPVNIQNNINSLYDAGGEKRLEAIRYASNVFSQVGNDNTLANMLTSQSNPLSQAEVQAQTGQVSGKQLVLGNIYNAAVPATIEGVGQLANSVFVAPVEKLLTGETKMAESVQKSLEKTFESKKVYIDEASKIAPVSVGTDGKIDWSNVTNTRAWAGLLSQGVGSMLPSLIPGVGAIAAVKTGANAAKAINIAKTTGLLLSTAQMYPELQREGLKNKLSFGESSAFAGVLSLGMGAVEMLSFNSMLKGFGLTAKEVPTVIREMTKDAVQREIKELGTKGFTSATFNEAMDRVSKQVAKDVTNAEKVGRFASVAKASRGLGSAIGRGVREGGLVEGSEEFIQGMMEYMGKEVYNNWLASEGTKEGQGQYTVDFKESLVNSFLGATAGGILGTGLGSLYKQNGGTKVLDQSLYGLVKADINTQILDGQTDFNKILENNAFKGIVETAREEGQFNNEDGSFNEANYNDALRRGNLMYQTAFEFKDVPNTDDKTVMSMYKMANKRDELAISTDSLNQSLTQLQAIDEEMNLAKQERRFVDLAKLNTQKATLQTSLGAINPETGRYVVQEDLDRQTEQYEQLFSNSITPMIDTEERSRSRAHMMLQSGMSAIASEEFTPEREVILGDGRVILRGKTNTDGVHIRELQIEELTTPIEGEPTIAEQIDKGTYTPKTRYKYTVSPILDYETFGTSVETFDTPKRTQAARKLDKPFNYEADADAVVGEVTNRVQEENRSDLKDYDALLNSVDNGRTVMNQVLKQSGVDSEMSIEEFDSLVGFEREVLPLPELMLTPQEELVTPEPDDVSKLPSSEISSLLSNIVPSNAEDMAMLYFAQGGKINSKLIKSIYGDGQKSIKGETDARTVMFDKNSSIETLDRLGEVISEMPENYTGVDEKRFDDRELSEGAVVALNESNGPRQMANKLILKYDSDFRFTENPELNANLSSLSEDSDIELSDDINEEIDGETINTETGGESTIESPTVESSILREQELEQALGDLQTQETELSGQLESANAIANQEQEGELTDEYVSGLTQQLESTNRQLESEYGQTEIAIGQNIGEAIEESSDSDTSQEGDGDTQQEVVSPITDEELEALYDDDGSELPFQFDSKETSVSTPLGQDILARLQGSFPNINLSIPSSVESYLGVLNSIPSVNELFTPDNRPYGFVNPVDGSIYLDPSRLNPNTAIHEYGHVWVISQRGTDIYNRGIGLVANTAYATSVKNDPRYANLTQDQVLEEALAQAIGDKGSRFILTSKKNSLLDFIGELFNKIKEFFGLKSNNVSDMTFDEFIQESVESILSGNEVSGISSEDLASLMSVPVAKTTIGANQYGDDSIPTVYGEGITAEEKYNNMQSTGEVLFSYKAPPTKDFATNDETGELTGTWDDFILKAKEMLVQYDLLGKNAADFTAADKVALTHIQKRTGFIYKGRNGSVEGQQAPKGVWSDKYDLFEHDLKNANETFYMADGRLTTQPVKGMAGTERGSLVSAIQKGLSFYQDLDPNTSYGRFMKGALDSVLAPGGLANNETLFTFLDGGEGVIISLLKDVKRLGEKNQAYLLSHIAPKLERTKELMRDYSTFGNQFNVDAVKKMDLEVYEWNPVTRRGEKRTIVVPIGTAMHILSDIESQEATGQQYLTGKGKNGDVFHETAVLPSDLFRGDDIDESNVEEFFFGKTFSASSGGEVQSIRKGVHVRADLLRMRDDKGNLVRLTDINGGNVAEYPILISPSTKTRLQNRFNKAIGAENDNEVEAYKAAREVLNDPLLTKMLEDENKMLNPLDTFKRIEKEIDGVKVGMYSPIRPVKSVADNGRDVAYSPRIEEARILNERTHRPDAIYASDLLASIDSYIDTSSNVVGNGRLVHNMESLKNAIDKEYDGVARDKISKVLGTNIEQLSNYKQYLSKKLDDSTYASFLDKLIKKYTKWIFAGNIGIAAKQIGTILSAFGQGYIDDGYLLSVAVPQSLKLLGGGIYDTFRGAGSTVVEGTDQGQRTYTGAMTVEKKQLDWLLGNHLTDPVQREAHRQRWAVVINRTLTGQNQYLAKFDVSDITATPEGAGKLRSGWDKVGNFLEEHGMAPMKRADRAAILAFVEAAKAQVNNEVKNGITAQEDADDRIATITTNLVYDTNQMNSVADFTGAQRSASPLTKIITLYSGQTQKLFNQILQRGAEYHQIINDPNASEEDKSLARRRLAGSLVSNLVSNPAYMAITTLGWGYMRAIMNGDEPPEEDESEIAKDFWWAYARYAGGVIPGMTEQIMTLTISNLDNEPWSEGLLEVPGAAALTSSIDIVKSLYNAISEDDIEKQKKYTEGLWYHGSQIIGVATGLPKPLTDLVREHMTIDRDDRLRGEE